MPHRVTAVAVVCLALQFACSQAYAQLPATKQPAPRTDFFGDPLPQGAIARLGSVRFHHQGGLIAAAFSPDSKTILAAGNDKSGISLRFWEIATGKELSRFTIKDSGLHRLRFAPDAKSVFVGCSRHVELYDCLNGRLILRFGDKSTGHIGSQFALSPDGKWLATNSNGKDYTHVIHIWEVPTGAERASLNGQRGDFHGCQFSSDGKRLISFTSGVEGKGEQHGTICIWDVATGQKMHEVGNDDRSALAFAPDGETVALRERNANNLQILNVATGKTLCLIPETECGVQFTGDSKAVATATRHGSFPRLWNAVTGKEIRRFKKQHESNQFLVGFSPDGKLLAVRTGDWSHESTVLLWDVATGEPIQNWAGHMDTVTALAFAPDGKLVASGSLDSTVRLWDPATGKEQTILGHHEAGVTALAFSPDSSMLASSASAGSIRLWDIVKRREIAKFNGPETGVAALAFSLDGKSLIVGGRSARQFGPGDKSTAIQIWDLAASKLTSSLDIGHEGHVYALSLDGMVAASGNKEMQFAIFISTEKLHLRRLPTGKTQLSVDLRRPDQPAYHGNFCWTAALSADGTLLAAGQSTVSNQLRGGHYADYAVRIWERATGQQLHIMSDVVAKSLAFSPSGRLLAIGHGNNDSFHNRSRDSRVTIWDMATGESVRECQGHANEVACVAFSPDGNLVVSGSADHTILVWSDFGPVQPKGNATRPTVKELGVWWENLGSSNSSARDATLKLLAHSDQAIRWMAEHFKPAVAVDKAKIAGLIESLESDSYKTRQAAMEALEQMGDLAEHELRQAIAGNPTLERRRRVELLLDKVDRIPATREQLQQVRALALLEWINTVEAREVLATLAKGATEARLTRMAQTTLSRLLRTSAAP